MDPRKLPLLLAAAVLVLVLAFCLFGFLATFEPLEDGRALTWRLVYGGVGALSVLGIALLGARFRRL
jgi:hypothetical protein